jgi:hypothetical protein
MTDETDELQTIADSVVRGDDPYVVPEELIEEPEPPKPISQSLYMQITHMTVGERIKVALKGNREARTILIHDTNRLIQRYVLQNPRITDDEIIGAARNRNMDVEILRLIAANKQWSRNSQIRLALVTNPKTPLASALHFVGMLTDRDIRFLAKSKNISSTVAEQARRILMQRQGK